MRFKQTVILLLGIALTGAFARADEPLKILALGDSITAGTPGFSSPVETPPAGSGNEQSQYEYWIVKAHPEWTVLNKGVKGERTDQIFSRFEKYMAADVPQMVIVMAGVNDLFQDRSADDVKVNLNKIYDLAIEKNIGVVACTILPYNYSTPQVKERMQKVNEWIKGYAKSHGFIFCDTYSVMNDSQNPGNLVSSADGLHPDVAGYKKLGEALEKAINI